MIELKTILKISGIVFILAILAACIKDNPVSEGVEDANQLQALKNVDFIFEDVSFEVAGIPTGSDLTVPFDTLLEQNPDKYSEPSSYTITFSLNMIADNTSSDAEDAKFDGINVNMEFNNITNAPLTLSRGTLAIPKGEEVPFTASGSLNLETHKEPRKYIFQQMVDGEDIASEIFPEILYKFGKLEGSLVLPSWEQAIPTRASPETKAFLSDLLASGLLD